MKKILFLSLILISTTVNSVAQKYSINKTKYDSHQYIPQLGDPYNPALCGVGSFFIPGLGQIISGETGRGLAFFGAYTGAAIVYGVGAFQTTLYTSSLIDNYGSYNAPSGVGTMLLGLAGMGVISIWSIIDAVKVAKTNNMYIRDVRKTSLLDVNLTPYAETLTINNQTVTPVGLSLRITF